MAKLAVVQEASVLRDRRKTIEKAVRIIAALLARIGLAMPSMGLVSACSFATSQSGDSHESGEGETLDCARMYKNNIRAGQRKSLKTFDYL